MILFFDTETTGLSPGNICQLSYIMEYNNKSVSKNFFFEVDFVNPSAQAVHGFSKQKLQILSGGRRFFHYKEEIYEDFKEADLIISHNLSFDLNFLINEFDNNDMRFIYKQGLCSMRHFTPICRILRANGKGYKYPKLGELAEYFGLYPYDTAINTLKFFKCDVNAHDARYDTTMLYMSLKNAITKDDTFKEVYEKNL
jgi:DNA polymerase-3 subunit epsilon